MAKCLSCGDRLPIRPKGTPGPEPIYCSKVTCNAQYRNKKPTTSFQISRSFHGWTKYGGGNHNLSKRNREDWHCQLCGDLQPKEIYGYPYFIGVSKREFVRVCGYCHHKGIQKKISSFRELMSLVRRNL